MSAKQKQAKAIFTSPRKILVFTLIVFFSGLLVNIIISFFLGFENLIASLGKTQLIQILLPFLIYCFIYLIDALRLKMVLKQFSQKISLKDAYLNGLLGYFFSYLTPMATGGQPFQIYHLKKLGIPAQTSTNIIASRFVEYLCSSFLIVLIFIAPLIPILKASGADTSFLLAGFIISAGFSILIIIAFIKPDLISNFLVKIGRSRAFYFLNRFLPKNWADKASNWAYGLKKSINFLWKERLGIVAIDIFLCIFILALQVFSLVVIMILAGEKSVNFLQIFSVVMLLNLVVYYIPTPGASGGLESIYTVVLGYICNNFQLAFISVVIWRFATYYCQILLGIIIFFFLRKKGLFKLNNSSIILL